MARMRPQMHSVKGHYIPGSISGNTKFRLQIAPTQQFVYI